MRTWRKEFNSSRNVNQTVLAADFVFTTIETTRKHRDRIADTRRRRGRAEVSARGKVGMVFMGRVSDDNVQHSPGGPFPCSNS